MPELPEVETIRRQLAPAIEGRRLERIDVRDPRWCEPAPPEALADALNGRLIERLGRRGKYLIVSFDDDVHLVMHLRMTGNLLLVPAGEEEPGHLRVVMELDDEKRVLFVDVRRFGTGDVLLGSDALAEYFTSRLGVEPVGPLKRPQIGALRDAVVETLEEGIDAKGASIDDYRHVDGAEGSFQDRFLVHTREGEPCPRCGTTIRKLRAAGRGTSVCPRCQPVPRRRRDGK